MNVVKEYKQYFTPTNLAEFMVNLIPDIDIEKVIDLSMGECGLLDAAKLRWSNATFFGVDIDEKLVKKINNISPYIHTFSCDGLLEMNEWEEYQNILTDSKFDLAIANPPFNYYDQSSVNLSNNESVLMPVEIRFLLKYIDIIKDGGYVCIILPYGFLSIDSYNELRVKILERGIIRKVIKIFDNCFDKIDVDTCLLLFQKKTKKRKVIQKKITLEYLDDNYCLKKIIEADISKSNTRLDLEYHKLINQFKINEKMLSLPIRPLKDYVLSIKRGKTIVKKKDLISEKGTRFLHTTDVKQLYISNDKSKFVKKNNSYFVNSTVEKNNILIGRVGKACIGKVAVVTNRYNKAVISDCLFCLKIAGIDVFYLALYLATQYGLSQLKGFAKGSCSKYITKEDLLQLRIIIPPICIQQHYRDKYMSILYIKGGKKKNLLLKQLILELEMYLRKE